MICLLNASDYQAGTSASSPSTAIFGGTDSSSSESPDSPISVVSSTSSDSSTKSPTTVSPRPSTPNQRLLDCSDQKVEESEKSCHLKIFSGWRRFVVEQTEHRYESPSGEVFSSKKDVENHIIRSTNHISFNADMIDSYFDSVDCNNVENTSDNQAAIVVPFTFCDMQPNIVDMKRKKARKPSREFNKRRRRSTTNVGKINSRRSTNSSSTSLDEFDDVGSPLTLELQELLSEVVKNVAERLERVDEEEEEQELIFIDHSKEPIVNSKNAEAEVETNLQIVETSDLKNRGDNVSGLSADKPSVEDGMLVEVTETSDLEKLPTEEKTEDSCLTTENKDTAASETIQSISDNNLISDKVKLQKTIFSSKKILKRRSTVDNQSQVSSSKSKRKRRSSVESYFVDEPLRSAKCEQDVDTSDIVLNALPSTTTEMQIDHEESKLLETIKNDEVKKPTVLVPHIFKENSSKPAAMSNRRRPSSLDLSSRKVLNSKRKRLSGSVTPDSDGGSKFLDFLRSSLTDRPISADVLESPQDVFYPPGTQTSPACLTDPEKRRSLPCDDFEDEIAACNDFEEVELEGLRFDEDDLNEQDDQDPLALSDKDICSPVGSCGDLSTKDCRIDLVDMFSETPLTSFLCCGCESQYSASDLFSFDLSSGTMARICGTCFWWTSRRCGMQTKKF